MKTIASILICFLLLSIWSCNKPKDTQWKEPTDVKFKVDINRSIGFSGNLAFTSGTIILGSFTFDGDKVSGQGEDYYFNNNYPDGLPISFDSNNTIPKLDFDIPQGTYSKIRISFQTLAGDSNLVVKGTYKNSFLPLIFPIRFEFDAPVFYSVIAKDGSGSTEIVLDKNNTYTPVIKFDPTYWFQPVPVSMLDSAELSWLPIPTFPWWTPIILINDSINTDIYNIVANRLDDAMEVTFD